MRVTLQRRFRIGQSMRFYDRYEIASATANGGRFGPRLRHHGVSYPTLERPPEELDRQ
jgi:hypothetical protein